MEGLRRLNQPSRDRSPGGGGAGHAPPWEPPHTRQLLTGDEVEVEHLFAEADPRLALDSCADAALVAVGPRGRGLLKQLHIGSTTEWLIGAHRPLAPVVVVHSARATKEVLLCTDGSDHAQKALEALEALLDMPWLTSCRVSVLGVADDRNKPEAAVERAVAVFKDRGVDRVRHEVVEAPRGNVRFDARSVILTTVAEQAPDLVAVGARGTGGFSGLLTGSVTAAVVHHAPRSVLVAKSG